MVKKFGIVSASDLHGIRVAVIVIVFWTGIWNLLEILATYIEEKTTLSRVEIFGAMTLLALFIILVDPYTFEGLL
jgi:hypothetical protein